MRIYSKTRELVQMRKLISKCFDWEYVVLFLQELNYKDLCCRKLKEYELVRCCWFFSKKKKDLGQQIELLRKIMSVYRFVRSCTTKTYHIILFFFDEKADFKSCFVRTMWKSCFLWLSFCLLIATIFTSSSFPQFVFPCGRRD